MYAQHVTTLRELAEELNVPMASLLRRLMQLHSMKRADEVLTSAEEEILRSESKLGLLPEPSGYTVESDPRGV